MGGPRSQPAPPLTRSRVLFGGLLGVVLGLSLFALSLFFLFVAWASPEEVGGVMMPLTMAIPALSFGIGALLPLWRGDVPETVVVMANTWILIGVGAALIIVGGIIRSHTPWATFAVLPILVDGALFRSALSLRRGAMNARS